MADIILDSDVIIEVLRGNDEIIAELISLQHSGKTLCITPIAKTEIYHGTRRPEEKAVAHFFSSCRSLPITDEVGEKAGRYLASYHKSHSVDLADALIAAVTSLHRATLFTLNRKHYPMPDIRLHHF